MKPHQESETEPFFITEDVEVTLIAAGYVFEPPPIACLRRLRYVLGRLTDAELALQPGEIAEQEHGRRGSKAAMNWIWHFSWFSFSCHT